MNISNAVVKSHVLNEKFVYARNMQEEINLNNEIKRVWAIDKETIQTGFRNGPIFTQHGVNAEYQHIADSNINEIRQAAQEGRDAVLMAKSPEVNGPADMVRGEQLFQAKYYNNPKGSLDACIEHLEKYEEMFGANTNSVYVIPPEHYSTLLAVKSGQVPEGITARQAEGIRASIEQFEAKKGAIEDCIQSGSVTYAEAQIDNVDNAIKQKEIKIEEEHKTKKAEIKAETSPSVSKMFKRAGISAALKASITAYQRISGDRKNGKNIFAGEYKKDDYHTLAKEVATSGALAGADSCAIYGINATFKKSASPVVAAYTVAKDITVLVMKYKTNQISVEELRAGIYLSVGMVALGALSDAAVVNILNYVFTKLKDSNKDKNKDTLSTKEKDAIYCLAFIAANIAIGVAIKYTVVRYGDRIKETVLNLRRSLSKKRKAKKIKLREYKKEAGWGVKAAPADISSRFKAFKC